MIIITVEKVTIMIIIIIEKVTITIIITVEKVFLKHLAVSFIPRSLQSWNARTSTPKLASPFL